MENLQSRHETTPEDSVRLNVCNTASGSTHDTCKGRGSALYAAVKVVHYHDTVHHNLTRILLMKAFLQHWQHHGCYMHEGHKQGVNIVEMPILMPQPEYKKLTYCFRIYTVEACTHRHLSIVDIITTKSTESFFNLVASRD